MDNTNSLYVQLQKKLIQFQKEKIEEKVGTLRYFLSLLKNREIELRPSGKELSNEDIFNLMKKQVKKMNEAIELFQKGNREDLVNRESAQRDFIIELAHEFFPETPIQ